MPDIARYKSFRIDKKSKTISFQPYEKRGASLAKQIIQKIAKSFGFGGWTVQFDRAHWG
jgi:hypothetical protein